MTSKNTGAGLVRKHIEGRRHRRKQAHRCNTCMYCSPVGPQPGGPDAPEVDPEAFECRVDPPARSGLRRPRVELMDWCASHPKNRALDEYRMRREWRALDDEHQDGK